MTANGRVDFVHCLATMGFISQCKVGKPWVSGQEFSLYLYSWCRFDSALLGIICHSRLASYCINELYICMMGEISILVELLANIPLTKQGTSLNSVKTWMDSCGGFLKKNDLLCSWQASETRQLLPIPATDWVLQVMYVTGERNELLFFRQS